MHRENFFHHLYQFCNGYLEIRPLPGRPAFFDIEDVAGIHSHCNKYSESNLFFGLATRDGQGGRKQNIVNIPALWADIDFKNISREIFAKKIKEFPFKPSAVINSGGGLHLYWILKEPVGKNKIDMVEDINHRIAAQLGGDHNSCDAARILRVPDTLNCKYVPPRCCKIVKTDNFYYNVEDFIEILPEALRREGDFVDKESTKDWLRNALRGVDQGKRNSTGAKIAGYFINKLSSKDLRLVLAAWNINNNPPLPEKEIEKIVKSISRYKKPTVESKSKVDISNVYDSAAMIAEYQEYIKTLKKNIFVTGIKEIDKKIRGVAGGEVLTIIARSGSFKTAMLQNLLKNYAQTSPCGAVFFSIEMPVASVAERYLQILDGSTGKEVENLFSDESQLEIQKAAENEFIKDLKRLFIVPTKVSLSDIVAYVQLIEREMNIKIGVIGIDYLGLMDGPGINEYEIISRLSSGLKSTAKLLNVPIIMLSQVNRKGGSGNNEISLDMGRGSGAIEEGADFVLGLWKVDNEADVLGKPEPIVASKLICRVLKNRKGPAGSKWKLNLIPSTLQILPDAEPYTSANKTKGFRL